MSDKNAIALVKKDTVDVVQSKIREFQETGELHFPANYSPENAMKSAWLERQNCKAKTNEKDSHGKWIYKPVLEYCTKDSIANSLLSMVVQGLTPAKKQCYFIAYGNQLDLQRSYFGTMAVTKRLKEIKDIRSQVIYEDDEFELLIENGEKKISKHIQKLQNIDMSKIVGAYCIIEKHNGSIHTEIMNMNQIKDAWGQSKMYPVDNNGKIKQDSVHGKFTDQMVLKTITNRACKTFANTSDDSDLLIEHFNKSTENEYKPKITVDDQVKQEIEDNANKEELDFQDDAVEVDFKEVTSEQQPTPTNEKIEGPDF